MGYPALARLIAREKSLAMFKRFGSLSAHSLLVQQAELLDLEVQLEAQAAVDRDNGMGYDEKATKLIHSSKPSDEQWRIILIIRDRLKDYYAALLQHSQVTALPAPNTFDSSVLREWLTRGDLGNNFLSGVEEVPWLEGETADLVALYRRDFDSTTRRIAERLVPWAYRHKLLPRVFSLRENDVGMVDWEGASFQRIARWMSVVASSLIPTLAIVVLYFIRNPIARILTAMGLSFVFSICLAGTTSARSAEIFAASAAFAAIQVVFIGSTSPSASRE